jgi:hypothetical protein
MLLAVCLFLHPSISRASVAPARERASQRAAFDARRIDALSDRVLQAAKSADEHKRADPQAKQDRQRWQDVTKFVRTAYHNRRLRRALKATKGEIELARHSSEGEERLEGCSSPVHVERMSRLLLRAKKLEWETTRRDFVEGRPADENVRRSIVRVGRRPTFDFKLRDLGQFFPDWTVERISNALDEGLAALERQVGTSSSSSPESSSQPEK